MLTFIISLTPKVTDLGLAAPFLYPLQDKGQVRVLLPPVQLETVDEFIRIEVQYSHVPEWQVYFILHQDDSLTNPLEGSLATVLWQIQEQVLTPLASQGLYPQKVWIGVLDEMQRSSAAVIEPGQPRSRQRWQLDTTGKLDGEDFPYLFNQGDIDSLSRIWGRPLTLSDQRADEGLTSLPQDMQHEIQRRVEALKKQATEIINVKQEALKNLTFPWTSPFLDPQILEKILAEYHTYLENCCTSATIDWVATGKPAEEFPRIISRHLSLQAFNQNLVMIFFPEARNTHFQLNLLHIVYGIITLATLPETSSLANGRIYRFHLELDQDAWGRCLADHRRLLVESLAKLSEDLKTSPEVILEEPDNSANICRQTLEQVALKELAFGLTRHPLDSEKWHGWEKEAGKNIADQVARARKMLRQCHQELAQPKSSGLEKKEAYLNNYIHELQKKLQQERLDLIRAEQIWPDLKPTSEVEEAGAKDVSEAISQRPNRRYFGRTVASGVLLAAMPQLVYAFKTGIVEQYQTVAVFLAAILLFSLASAFLALWQLRSTLRKFFRKVKQAVEESLSGIQRNFSSAKECLQKLSMWKMFRRTLLQAQNLAQAASRRRLQIRYHQDHIRQHLNQVDQMLNLFNLQVKTVNEPTVLPRLEKFDVARPVIANDLYSPPLCSVEAGAVSIPLQVGQQYTTMQHLCLQGVAKVIFKDMPLV